MGLRVAFIFIGTMSSLAAIYKYTRACIENEVKHRLNPMEMKIKIFCIAHLCRRLSVVASQAIIAPTNDQTFSPSASRMPFEAITKEYLHVLRQSLVRPVLDEAYP